MMKIALTVLVIITASPLAGGTLPQSAKVLFPNQDDHNEYTGSGNGCDLPPQLLEPVERLVSTSFRQNYVRYDIARLNSKHIHGLYYVYSKEACRRLRRYFPANVFVMARLVLRKCEFLPAGTTRSWYDVEAKVYCVASGKETIIFRYRNVAREEVGNLLVGKEREIFQLVEAAVLKAAPDSSLHRTRTGALLYSAGPALSRRRFAPVSSKR